MAATKASPATEEPVKRTATKTTAKKASPTKSANGSAPAKKAAKRAPAKKAGAKGDTPAGRGKKAASAEGKPSAANVDAFETAVAEVTATTERLLAGLAPRRQPPKTVPPLRRPEVRARLGLA